MIMLIDRTVGPKTYRWQRSFNKIIKKNEKCYYITNGTKMQRKKMTAGKCRGATYLAPVDQLVDSNQSHIKYRYQQSKY